MGQRVRARRSVVTGGAGFVGSHVVEALVERGDEVLVVDDLSRGRPEHLSAVDGRYELEVGDLRDEAPPVAVAAFEPDAVFHLAALHYIPECVARPADTWAINVEATARLLGALARQPVGSFVFASSAAVYGFADAPHPESAPHRPGDVYGASKAAGERLLDRFASHQRGWRVVAARLGNVYGPRETNPHVVPGLVAAARRGEPVVVGNTWPERDYVHVTDVASALSRLDAGRPGRATYNVATGEGHSVGALLDRLGSILDRRLEVRIEPARCRPDDGHLLADVRRIHDEVGWRAQVDLDAGLRSLLEGERVAVA